MHADGGRIGVAPVVRRAPRARGFMLLVIIIIGAAAMASAIVLISVGGNTRQIGAKAEGEDRARALAWTGAERAFLYLQEIVKANRDFDRVLAPTDLCTVNGLPTYTDGTPVVIDGRTFTLVELDGGAYATRFFDDADDLSTATAFAGFTDNHLGAGNTCREGPLATNGDNPARDRDRSLWVEVIGMHAGADPARATHKTKLVRLFVGNAPTPELVVTVGKKMDLDDVDFCANGDIASGDDAKVTGSLGMCGRLSSGGSITAPPVVAPSPACTPACSSAGPPSPGVPLTPVFPNVPNLFDPTSFCNFYLRDSGIVGAGFWYWDPTVLFGGIACSTYPTTGGIPDPVGVGAGVCWVPVMTPANDFTQVAAAAPVLPWTFNSATMSGAASNGGGNFPDWKGTCAGKSTWPLPSGGTAIQRTIGGDVARYENSGDWTIVADAPTSAPPGLYFVMVGAGKDLTFEPAVGTFDPTVEGDWAPMTIMAMADTTLKGGAGAIGTAVGAPYASLVVNGDLKIQAAVQFRGSVFVGGKLTVDQPAHFYGRLHVKDDANFNAPLMVDYGGEFREPGSTAPVFPTPLTARAP